MTETTFHVVQVKLTPEKNRYSIKSPSGEWYSAFGTTNVKAGDEVKMQFTQNGIFKNIDKVEVISSNNPIPETARPSSTKSDYKASTMLTSYAKDILVALIANGAQDVDKAAKDATQTIMKIYDTFELELKKSQS